MTSVMSCNLLGQFSCVVKPRSKLLLWHNQVNEWKLYCRLTARENVFVQVTIGFVLSSGWMAFMTSPSCVFPRFVLVGHVILPWNLIGSFEYWVCSDWLEMIVASTLFNHAFAWWTRPLGEIFWCFDLGKNVVFNTTSKAAESNSVYSPPFLCLNIAVFFVFVVFFCQFVAKKLQEIPLSIRDQYVFSTAPINIKKPLTVNLAIQVWESFLPWIFTLFKCQGMKIRKFLLIN